MREMVRQVVEGYPDLPGEAFVMARQENLETIHRHNVVAERYGTLDDLRDELDERRAPERRHLTMREWLEAPAPRSPPARPRFSPPRALARSCLDPLAQAEEVVGAADQGGGDGEVDEHVDPGGAGLAAIRAKTAAICSTVFTLPSQLAEITMPRSAAIARITVTANSRAMITIATQAASRSSETSETSAATISSLSAIGSISLPKVVTASRERAK